MSAMRKKGSQQAAKVKRIVNKAVMALRSRFSAAFFFHWEILPRILLTVTKGDEAPRKGQRSKVKGQRSKVMEGHIDRMQKNFQKCFQSHFLEIK